MKMDGKKISFSEICLNVIGPFFGSNFMSKTKISFQFTVFSNINILVRTISRLFFLQFYCYLVTIFPFYSKGLNFE